MSTIARAIRVWWNVDFISGLSKIKIAPIGIDISHVIEIHLSPYFLNVNNCKSNQGVVER